MKITHNLSNAKWANPDNTLVSATLDGAVVSIPVEHELYSALVEQGVPIAPYVPPVVLVTEVSPYQARVALLQVELLDDVEALMLNENTPREAKIAWEYSTVIQRKSPFINTLGPALGLTEAQIDDLFRAAAQVV